VQEIGSFQPRVKSIRPVVIVDIDKKSLADPRLGRHQAVARAVGRMGGLACSSA